jgi:hypothetical protein
MTFEVRKGNTTVRSVWTNTCSNPLGVRSPFIGRARLHTTQSFGARITRSHSSRLSSPRPSHKKTVGPGSFPQNVVVPLPALSRLGEELEGSRRYRRLSL